jgi:sulfur carrier protein ThiS
MFVKVAKIGSAVKEVMLADGATLEQALAAAEVDSDGFQVRVNGRTPCGTIADGDMITLVPAIKGGN